MHSQKGAITQMFKLRSLLKVVSGEWGVGSREWGKRLSLFVVCETHQESCTTFNKAFACRVGTGC